MSAVDGPALDLQIAGVQDDGTSEGIVRAKLANGELVRIPFVDIETATLTSGGASASLNRNAYSNGDHTGVGFNMSTAAGLGTNIAAISAVIYGRTVGIRFRKLASTPPFSVVIDGVPYGVPLMQRQSYFDNTLGSGLGASKEGVFAVSDLPDGPHSVRIVLPPETANGRSIVVYGFLGEKVAGYVAPTGFDSFFGGGTLTNAAVAVPVTDNAGNANHGIKSIIYRNTDASARIVTVTWNSVDIFTKSLAAAGTDGDSFKLDLSSVGINPGTSPNLTHKASVTSVVTFVCVGAF